MIRKAVIGASILLLSWLGAGCLGPEQNGEQPRSGVTESPGADIGQVDKQPQDETGKGGETLALREAIKDLMLVEEKDGNTRMVASLPDPGASSGTITLGHHWDKAVIIIRIPVMEGIMPRQVLTQLTLNGKQADFRKLDDFGQYELAVNQSLGGVSELQYGGKSFVAVKRMDTLLVSAVTTSGAERKDVLILQREDEGLHVMNPLEDRELILRFSEDMQPNPVRTAEGEPVEATWKDSRQLVLSFQEEVLANGVAEAAWTSNAIEVNLDGDSLVAESGNRLAPYSSLSISRVPEALWYWGNTGLQFEAGPRGRYYSQLSLSPDGSRFAGIVLLGGSQGDSSGWSYSFVLEGLNPVVMEQSFFTDIAPASIPIHWMDGRRLVYANYEGVYTFQTEASKKNKLYSRENLRFAGWDPYRERLYAVSYTGNEQPASANAYIIGKDGTELGERRGYSPLAAENRYWLLNLPVTPSRQGIYWTVVKDGVPTTEYMEEDELKASTAGIVRLLADEGAYVETYSNEPQNVTSQGWELWKPGQKARKLPPAPDPDLTGRFFPWGRELILETQGAYYRYVPGQDAWMPWKSRGGGVQAKPVAGPAGFYKVYSGKR